MATTSELLTLASQAMLGLQTTRGNIVNLSSQGRATSKDVDFSFTLNRPTLTAPPKFSDMFKGVDGSDPEILRLNNEVDAYVAKYFPHLNECLKTIPDEWLCAVIGGTKPFGIDSTIFDLVWQRARDRARKSAISQSKTLEANMSARGFSMPPGAIIDMNMEMEAKVSEAEAEANRDAMIKDAEIKADILKFAEEQALRYKLGLFQAMMDALRAWIAVPNNVVEREKARAAALSAYYDAISSYHKVELAFEELRLEAAKTDKEFDLQNVKNDLIAAEIRSKSNIEPLGAAAQAFGHAVAGAASAASTLVAQIESL